MSAPPWTIVARDDDGAVLVTVDGRGAEQARRRVALAELPSALGDDVRPVWNDTAQWYPALLDAGMTLARCRDLRLSHAILRDSALVDAPPLRAATAWDAGPSTVSGAPSPALFELDELAPGIPDRVDEVLAEFARQQAAVDGSRDPGRLRLLLAAESAGALVAAELHAAGVPWDRGVHEAILTDVLGGRPGPGSHAPRAEELATRIRELLGDPQASLDSQPKLLRALHRVGVLASSTSRWELAEHDHPVVAPLLEYKRLTRLESANGWNWLDEWAGGGRFRPVYVPGGVVTGRWASSGGGALQLPRQLRPAVRADEGWLLVVADVAQLEPRVLAAMSGDLALADAARGTDLYQGIVASGVVGTRQEAKIAVLGAMYGGTTGDSGRLVPALRRAYPRAMALVDEAARVGEEGGVVSTWLGRSAPPPPASWHRVQQRAADPDADDADRARAVRAARDRGRFTRNFVVQGTAAEWALAWLADLRGRLAALPVVPEDRRAPLSGVALGGRAHLAFFLHDEIVLHAPEEQAELAAQAVRDAADAATRLLFGTFPVDFPLDLRISRDAGKALLE
ncbi:bifunctional 3'-5' exonuclease/DNA polymerase [Microbacterium sp. No. 7]|uniref:bifunctional 3'-5' exonuclease/DNA polymerase n=1 Tax=Microbacterium sp. No. 7 TaxID=1714373 RepID=UPI0006D1CDE3|nr:bifunctional 3'-5' exonuclease/DNA polymerase [Microbacterium sp. No. 7]ALJ20467.1 3'-5' exonuclease [Microbacterium sp. No. 7]